LVSFFLFLSIFILTDTII